GGVARARHALLPGGEHRGSAALPDGEGGASVLAEVQLLERHRVRVVRGQQLLDARVQLGQTHLRRRASGGANHAGTHRSPAARAARATRGRHDTEAGAGEAGVDAENDHRELILRVPPDACLPYAALVCRRSGSTSPPRACSMGRRASSAPIAWACWKTSSLKAFRSRNY